MSKIVELRDKVHSITQINKAAQAMQIVAVAQLKEAQSRQRTASHFKKHYGRLAKRLDLERHSLDAKEAKQVALVYVLTSERGFCGGFNENLMSRLNSFVTKQEEQGREVRVVIVGKKGCELCQGVELPGTTKEISHLNKDGYESVTKDVEVAYQAYLKKELVEVYLFYNEFESMLVQRPTLLRLLPFDLEDVSVSAEDITFDLPVETVRDFVSQQYAKAVFYDAFRQTALGEISARLMTMRNATENSKEMLQTLNLKLNKARQAMITVELSEIVSSFEIMTEEG